MREVCEGFSPFEVVLGAPKIIGDNILYINVQSQQESKLHEKLVQAIAPSKQLIQQLKSKLILLLDCQK